MSELLEIIGLIAIIIFGIIIISFLCAKEALIVFCTLCAVMIVSTRDNKE